jgi:outer membrane protein OmpA-like peptidoglycan-associated protein
MVDTTHEDLKSGGGHRADEIHVHRRERKSMGPWLGLLALGLGLMALWGYGKSRQHIVAATCAETTVHFADGTAALSSDDKVALHQLGSCLKANPAQSVRLEGRADPDELERNGALPRVRSEQMARELEAVGVPAVQYSIVPMAPACTDDTDACSQKNRSVTATPLRH